MADKDFSLFNERWFEVFNYLYRNHKMSTPSNDKRFLSFMRKLSQKNSDVYESLIKHLNDTAPEKIVELLRKKG